MLQLSNQGGCFCLDSASQTCITHRRENTEIFEHPMHLKCALAWFSRNLSCPTCTIPIPVAELITPRILYETAKLAPEYTSSLAKRIALGLVCGAAILATIHLAKNTFS